MQQVQQINLFLLLSLLIFNVDLIFLIVISSSSILFPDFAKKNLYHLNYHLIPLILKNIYHLN